MNGPASQLLTSVAVFRGELGRMLLALGIVLLVLILALALEHWRLGIVGWLGVLAMCVIGAAGLVIAALIVLGLL